MPTNLQSRPVRVIGLTGAVAGGKSTAAAAMARRGAKVYDADKIGHAQLDDPAVIAELASHWGDDIKRADGRIDRGEIARRVFADSAKAAKDRLFLEQTLHPLIREEIERSVQQLASTDVVAAVIEAPLLFEVGWNDFCDHTVFVDSPADIRRQRAQCRGWTDAEFDDRESSQMPAAQKRMLADFVLENRGTLEQLDRQVGRLWSQLFPSESS